MMFSRPVEYAIRAMTMLASQKPGKLTGARTISEVENIPMPFLWKVLRILARRKLVRSFKGIRGGYELARPAEKITINDIFLATDGTDFRETCVLGLPECDDQYPCPLHEQWRQIRSRMTELLDHTSVADLAMVTQRRQKSRRS